MRKNILLAFATTLAACAAGPDYKRPDAAVPAAYKEIDGWKQAAPSDAIDRGAWWEIFGDPVLNDLEQQLLASNQSLKQAQAQYVQAAALVSGARASYWPTLSASLSATRSGRYSNSGGGIVSGGTVISGSTSSNTISKSYQMPLTASWEPDLWGSVRRTVEGDVASAQSAAATWANTRLSLQGTLAQTYFQLRTADEQKRLLEDTVAAYEKSLKLTQNQYASGVAARSDVVQAQTQLESAKAQAINIGVARAQYEHAIAVLIGKLPAEFSLAPQKLPAAPPAIPLSLPSALLERRPDVAVAERSAAAASAQIGIADAAWFPTISLSASDGYSSSVWSHLLDAPSQYWSLGPRIAETIFDGGARKSQAAQARAGYDAAVANYRQVALAAFQNVEDQIAALRILEQQQTMQDAAMRDAEEALRITLNQYRSGTVSYINVLTAQTTAYSAEQTAVTLIGTRFNDSVALILALGGGWRAGDLPKAGDIDLHSQSPQAPAQQTPPPAK